MIGAFLLLLPALAFSEGTTQAPHGLFPDEIITASELNSWIRDGRTFLLLDARDKKNYEQAHLPTARLSMMEDYYREMELFRRGIIAKAPDFDAALKVSSAAYPKDQPIVTYCNTGCHAGAVLALKLKQLGFQQIRVMEEGLQDWEKRGYEVIRPPVLASSGLTS